MLGVLGGMGPLATVHFLRKIIEATPAERDQDHLPIVVYSVPQVPDRVGPILRGEGPSPLPAMIEGIRTLEAAGAEGIAIPCVTAHHWYDELSRAAKAPILHIADVTCAALRERGVTEGSVGLLATAATFRAGFFRTRLHAHGYRCIELSERDTAEFVSPAIALVKRGEIEAARALAGHAVERLLERDLGVVVLACTELPLALDGAEAALTVRCVDTVDALAKACVAWAMAGKRTAPDAR